jgi:hypothetical protein
MNPDLKAAVIFAVITIIGFAVIVYIATEYGFTR